MSQDMTTVSDERAALAREFAAPAASVSARMREIRLSVHMSKKPIDKGHFFIVDRNVEQGEDPIITDIGPEFDCIVLRDCMKLTAFDSDANTSLAESTEFRDFQNEPIFVIDNAGDRPCIATVAPYSAIKKMKYEPTKDEIKRGINVHPLYPVVKDLKLQYMAYVLYQGPNDETPGIYSVKIGARGWLGMEKNGEACRYGEEAETSFMKARSICHKKYKNATHMHQWHVFSSSFKTGEKDSNADPIVDYYPSFSIVGEWADDLLETVKQAQGLLKEWLIGQYGRRIGFAWRNTSDREFVPRPFQEMLDAATDGEELGEFILGGKRQSVAAKNQLSTGTKEAQDAAIDVTPEVAPARPARASRKSLDKETEDIAKDLGGDAPEAKEEPAAKPTGRVTVKSLFSGGTKKAAAAPGDSQRSIEDAADAAIKNVDAGTVKMQHTDPDAPGYVPPQWSDDEIAKDQGTKAKPAPVNAIPKGW